MKAMVLEKQGAPLVFAEVDKPSPKSGEILIEVSACGVCRTDLHVIEGDLKEPVLPLIPGHQIVGRVSALGEGVTEWAPGRRVGVPWLGGSCGTCRFCTSGRENLCGDARYTGYQLNGGFAEFVTARAAYCLPIPAGFEDMQAAPLLCAGLIGYRAYRMAGDAPVLGLFGFGSSAHIVIQVAVHDSRRVMAFTRPGDIEGQEFARGLGAEWAGDASMNPPEQLDAAIIFAPAGELVVAALRMLNRGGTVVCAGIHMSDIPSFPYRIIWGERSVRSVANLTRQDGLDFLPVASSIPITTTIQAYRLEDANRALSDLKNGKIKGSGVIKVGE